MTVLHPTGNRRPTPAGRDAVVGTALAGGFGTAWVLWAASGLDGAVAVLVRVIAVLLGIAVIGGAVRRARAGDAVGPRGPTASGTDTRRRSMFASTAYRLVVVGELIALFGGGAILNASGRAGYIAAWYAGVVGVHFVLFGRLFWSGFYALGAALVVAALVAVLVGLTGGGTGTVTATAGLGASATLFVAGLRSLSRSGDRQRRRADDRHPVAPPR